MPKVYGIWLHKYVCLHGDFSVRTAELSDLTITDDNILQECGVDSEIVYTSDILDILKRSDIDVKRVSKDRTVNAFGRTLLEFCRNSDMVILNGRAFGDKGIGATLCKGKSIVDYVMCTYFCISFYQVLM